MERITFDNFMDDQERSAHPLAYAVVERNWEDEEEHYGHVKLIISDIPEDTPRDDVKAAVTKAKRTCPDTDHFDLEDGTSWKNRTLLPADKWHDCPEIEKHFVSHWHVDRISYEDLLMEADGKCKLTLRVPIDLRDRLLNMAADDKQELDDYCIDVLAKYAVAPSELSHRDAVRALYRIYGDDKDAIIKGWVRLFELELIRIKKNPTNKPARIYAQQLYQDAVSMNRNWIEGLVEDSIVQTVRKALQE